MVEAVDIRAALEPLHVWRGRKPRGGDEESGGDYFATLAAYRDGAIFAGSFDGDSEWERHQNGDEVVQVLAGETELTVITADGPQLLRLGQGMLTVVPRGCWHRFHAPKGVTVLTVTPQPTEHSTAEDPRQAG
jgi:mannose-6-phosphate isomerase-like protein (cupin superfamily)